MDGWMDGCTDAALRPTPSLRRAPSDARRRNLRSVHRRLRRASPHFRERRINLNKNARQSLGSRASKPASLRARRETRDARPIRSVPIRLVRTYDAPSVNQSNRGAFAACAHTSRPSTCEDGSVVSVGVVVVGVVGVARRFHQSFRRNKNARDSRAPRSIAFPAPPR